MSDGNDQGSHDAAVRALSSGQSGGDNQPISHAQGFPSAVDGQKTKSLFEQQLGVGALKAESTNINTTVEQSVSGNLTSALFEDIQQHNMMNTNIADIADGTFFTPGNPGYGGLDFNLSGDIGVHNASLPAETELDYGLSLKGGGGGKSH